MVHGMIHDDLLADMTDDEDEHPIASDLDNVFLKTFLDMFAPAAERADPPPVHWVTDADDCASDYCLDCAEKAVKRSKREFPDAFVDGGWDGKRTSDTAACCCDCGKLLGYSLTKEGLEDELSHWTGVEPREDFNDDCCYEIHEMIDTAITCGNARHKAECRKIVQGLIAFIPQAPETDEVPAHL